MWDEIIFDLFQDIKVEPVTPHDMYVVSDTSLGLLSDTDDDVPPEVEKEVV